MIRSPVEFARYKRLRLFQKFSTNVEKNKLGPVINQPAGGLTGATPLTPHLTFGRSRQEGCTGAIGTLEPLERLEAKERRLNMAYVEPKGAVHWIDHYVVGTNDMGAWADWAVNATGITRRPLIGLTTAARKRNNKITCFLWWDGGSCRIGAFLQPEIYPPA